MPAMIFMHHTPRGCALVLGTSIKGRTYTKMRTDHPDYHLSNRMQNLLANYMRTYMAEKKARPTLQDLWARYEEFIPEERSAWKYLPSTPQTPTARILLKGGTI